MMVVEKGRMLHKCHRTSFPIHCTPEQGSLMLVSASSNKAHVAAFTGTCWWREVKNKKTLKKRLSYSVTGEANKDSSFFL